MANKPGNANVSLLPFSTIEAASSGDVDAINAVLRHYERYMAALATRRLYDENGVEHLCIDEEMFLKRNALLQGEIKELQSGIEELEEICHNKSEYRQAQEIFLPTTAHILDYYDRMTPEEKNRLWKLLMEKITYYRNPEKPDSIEIHLYPRLGRLISIS